MNIKKTTFFAFVAISTLAIGMSISNNSINLLKSAVGNENITTTLTYTHAPTTSTTFVDSVTKEYPPIYSTFVYKKVKASDGNLCELGVGGSIEKLEASNQLKSINIVFSGTPLAVYSKYSEDLDFTTYVNITNGTPVDIGGNYFKIYSAAGNVITSITLNYNCENAASGNTVGFRYMHSNDGGANYSGFQYGETMVGTKNINNAGTYRFEAEDTDPSFWTMKDNKPADEVTEFASGGKSMRPGQYSRLVFPFLLNKPSTVNLVAAISKYEDDWYLDSPGTPLSFWVSLDSQYLDQPHIALGHDNKPTPEAYWVWRNVDYGTFELDKGYHVVVMQFFSTNGPNVDYLDIIVSNYDIEHSYATRFNGNQTIFFGAKDVFAHGGVTIPDANWIAQHKTSNGCFEIVSWQGESTHSFAGYSHGTEYAFEFNLLNDADVQVKGYFASAHEYTLDASNTFLTIDGITQTVTGSITTGQGWFEYQTLTFGTYHLSSGNHRIKFALKQMANCVGFDMTTSNMDVSFIQVNGNGTYYLEAEDTRIDRSGWSIRPDFVAAGREPIETWTNSGPTPAINALTGVSLCGLNNGCQITIPITLNEDCDVEFQVIVAYIDGYAHDRLSTTIDGVVLNNPDTNVALASDDTSISTYWYWKVFKAGSMSLEAGNHVVILTLVSSCVNVDSFRFVVTNFNA